MQRRSGWFTYHGERVDCELFGGAVRILACPRCRRPFLLEGLTVWWFEDSRVTIDHAITCPHLCGWRAYVLDGEAHRIPRG